MPENTTNPRTSTVVANAESPGGDAAFPRLANSQPPTPERTTFRMSATAPPSDYDAIADLFLGEEDAAAPTRRTATQPPTQPDDAAPAAADAPALAIIPPAQAGEHPPVLPAAATDFVEGLMLGHLPVLASAWVPQYARHLADQRGEAITLIRFRGGNVEIDMVGLERVPASKSGGTCQTLDEALALAAQRTRSWLIRTDDTDEPALCASGGIDRVTLLAGADDVAVAATYRTLKYLSQQPGFEPGESSPRAQLRVLIMGVDEERAAGASEKLRQAAHAFLGRDVEVGVGAQKMGVTPTVTLYRAPATISVGELIGSLRSAIEKRTSSPAAPLALSDAMHGVVEIKPPALAIVPPGVRSDMHPQPPAASTTPQNTSQGTTMSTTAPASPVTIVQRNGAAKPAAPAIAPSIRPPAMREGDATIDFAAHVPGLTRLAFQCPYAKDVQLAADREGHLHLLARVSAEGDDPVGRLAGVAAWASDHRDLIALAVPSLKPVADANELRQHILADDPRVVLHLLHANVTIHVLVEVKTPTGSVFAAKQLN